VTTREHGGGNVKPLIHAFSILAVLLLASTAALAFDATGSWIGQWSCKEFDGVKFTSKQKPSTLLITQSGSEVFADIDGGDYVHDGHAIDDAKKPAEKGEILLIECASDNDGANGFGEIVRAVVKANASKGTGSFSGTSVYQDAGFGFAVFGTCKYKYKRTSTTDPNLTGCP
jgi:hypothetical protein